MGLTESVLTLCEAYLEQIAKNKWDMKDIDFESKEYYSWLVDEADKMADIVFDGIDSSIEAYFRSGNINPPPEKE